MCVGNVIPCRWGSAGQRDIPPSEREGTLDFARITCEQVLKGLSLVGERPCNLKGISRALRDRVPEDVRQVDVAGPEVQHQVDVVISAFGPEAERKVAVARHVGCGQSTGDTDEGGGCASDAGQLVSKSATC